MNFYYVEKKLARQKKQTDFHLCHEQGCNVCTLNHLPGLMHPHMPAHGSKHPLVYMLGEAPGAEEDRKGIPFVGKAGSTLRFRIPEEWNEHLRWNNVVRTRPPDNRQPTQHEIECCRPSIEEDIQATKPKAIFGFGNVPLRWAFGFEGITKWTGRRVPIKIGEHACWFFPILHPSYVMRTRRYEPRNINEYGSDIEFGFACDLERAFNCIDTLPPPLVHSQDAAKGNIELIKGVPGDLDHVYDFMTEMADEKVVGFDYETAGLRPYTQNAAILTFAISGKGRTMAVAMSHPEAAWDSNELEDLNELLKSFLHDAPPRKVAHNLAFEMEWSGFFFGRDCLWQSKWDDTMAQAFILDERRGCLSLDFLCVQYFGLKLKEMSNLDKENLAKMPLDEVLLYNAMDAKYHRLLYLKQRQRLVDEGLSNVYEHHLKRVPSCVLTQIKGVPVDQSISKQFEKKYIKRLKKIEAKIAALKCVRWFGREYEYEFRPSANMDLKKVLTHLGIHVESVDETQLLKVDHPIARLMLKWRESNKLLSTYVLPFQGLVFPDGLLHPILSTMKTRTWRTSSEEPNIQNQPKRENKETRSQVKPGGDLKVVAFDYAGIQARNVAMESEDPTLVKYFWERYDIHTDWMERIRKAVPAWMPKEAWAEGHKAYRNRAKNEFVFPLFFGAQPKSIAGYLKIPENKAQLLYDEFWNEFPEIKVWHERLMTNYRKLGYVTGHSGFRRRAPISPNEIINSPIQADESMIVLDAMQYLSSMCDWRFQPNIEVHDDLTFIWPKHEIEKNSEVVISAMLNVPFDWINVPLGVEMSVGDDWASVKEVGSYYSDKWSS